ncbi:RES domain-containing protein [Niallia endozanthoxylica]|uniref:RES domain-containing protein n=1 Tax=Niallia endozanthoxylica TaxID=2036016 RepID=UPI00168A59EC|nr:RES domain-containing protein [Niallia endozanthoxylica]
MYCCINCFEDEIIINYFHQEGHCGDCDYCGEADTQIVPIRELYDVYFQNLYSYYQETQHGEHYIYQIHDNPSDFGDSLYNLVQEDWGIFPDGSGEPLLYEIMNYGRDYEIEGNIDESVLFSRASDAFSYIDGSYLWDSLSNSLIKENRFFPKKDLDYYYSTDTLLGEIENLIKKYVVNINEQTEIFRARVGHFTDYKELQAPPFERILKGGRANPVGISVLYCAFSVETAISEVRPWKGAEVTVAKIKNKEKLNLIDLSKIDPIISPFQFKNIMSEVSSRNLLLILQQMLSRPINPNKSEIEYIPSQFLTEFIKSLKYDGLIFKSSLGKSNNLVIFDQLKTVIKQLDYFVVSNIECSFEKRLY